jgi:hypothetical protein
LIYKNTYPTFLSRLFLTTGLVVYVFFVNAQISPGKLSKAHSSLEGINQCTKCHELGAKVSDQKCLSCHEPLKVRIQQKKGYHASKEVTGKSCVTCHSEHHGVNFEMVRFDKKTFNHTLTGYELKGKHKTNDCAKCHRPEHISDPKLKLNKSTFLGLNPSCISCHDDYHKKTLDKDCKKCHDYEAFKPAPFFNHDKTGFPLAGAHKTVDCKLCHKVETTNGKTFQHFANVPFKNCNACHVDPHKGKFGVDCKSCHTVESFHKIKASSTFNHSITGFELEGKHKVIDCKKCHDNRAGTTDAYKEFSAVRDISCLTCHKDSHENKFGNDCSSCHSQWNFSVKDKLNDFDHKLTGYELSGKHEAVDCRKCHKETFMTAPLPHDACKKCHEDFHKGEFKDTPYTDCASCHTTTGFDLSSFDWEQHEKSAFPLKGAHLATPCIHVIKRITNGNSEISVIPVCPVMTTSMKVLSVKNIFRQMIVPRVITRMSGRVSPLIIIQQVLPWRENTSGFPVVPAILKKTKKEKSSRNLLLWIKIVWLVMTMYTVSSLKKTALRTVKDVMVLIPGTTASLIMIIPGLNWRAPI